MYPRAMPIFEYKCRQCSLQFEKLVRNDALPACPECQGADVEKLLSLPGISTQKSRGRTLKIAKTAAGKVKRDQAHAQREYEQHHINDHH